MSVKCKCGSKSTRLMSKMRRWLSKGRNPCIPQVTVNITVAALEASPTAVTCTVKPALKNKPFPHHTPTCQTFTLVRINHFAANNSAFWPQFLFSKNGIKKKVQLSKIADFENVGNYNNKI